MGLGAPCATDAARLSKPKDLHPKHKDFRCLDTFADVLRRWQPVMEGAEELTARHHNLRDVASGSWGGRRPPATFSSCKGIDS